jgi:hypothetical protein
MRSPCPVTVSVVVGRIVEVKMKVSNTVVVTVAVTVAVAVVVLGARESKIHELHTGQRSIRGIATERYRDIADVVVVYLDVTVVCFFRYPRRNVVVRAWSNHYISTW